VVLGLAFVAVVVGAGGAAVALYHFYWRAGKGPAPSRRAAQMYESVRIRPVPGMPGEPPGMAKAASYEVNPVIYSCHM
jgi:hypothetical protein